MKYQELSDTLSEIEESDLEYSIEVSNYLNHLSINGYVALRVDQVSSKYEHDSEIEIKLDTGEVIGSLIIRPLSGLILQENITNLKYIAFLNDIAKEDFPLREYRLSTSYLIIKNEFLREYYRKHYSYSSVWGGFIHKLDYPKFFPPKSSTTEITIRGVYKFPTEFNKMTSIKAVIEPFTFDRFLKKYHQLELISDLEVVNKIRALKTDLYGIGNLMSEYSSNDLNKFRMMLKLKIRNIHRISDLAFVATAYKGECEEIFQKYNKPGNPIPKSVEFSNLFALSSFSEVDLSSMKQTLTGSAYVNYILDVVSYWIYRIRCSIAHQRIGEFILTEKHEEFISQFIEPLIDEVLCQVYET
ncbi:MAG: hypothetical protein V4604_14210 [Bacteroidota bacterium]